MLQGKTTGKEKTVDTRIGAAEEATAAKPMIASDGPEGVSRHRAAPSVTVTCHANGGRAAGAAPAGRIG
jgi:hypothetical protein